jgi:hypothetical protein
MDFSVQQILLVIKIEIRLKTERKIYYSLLTKRNEKQRPFLMTFGPFHPQERKRLQQVNPAAAAAISHSANLRIIAAVCALVATPKGSKLPSDFPLIIPFLENQESPL